MTDIRPPGIGRAKLVGVAAVIGALIGIAAVYVTGGVKGNGDAVNCGGTPAIAAKLDPLARGEVAAFRPSSRPVSLAALTFTDGSGVERSIASFAGKTVLLNMWATWCVPCRREMPALDRLEAVAGDPAFQVVAVNIDTGDPARTRKFLADIGISRLAYFADPTLGLFNAMKSRGLAVGLPTTVLVDRKGCQLGVLAGPAEWDSEEAKALIAAAKAG